MDARILPAPGHQVPSRASPRRCPPLLPYRLKHRVRPAIAGDSPDRHDNWRRPGRLSTFVHPVLRCGTQPDPNRAGPLTSVPTPLADALSDRYRIERELGQGGMATVYLAHDLKHNRQVAIKVLRPELAAALGADRFLREIETTANLQHPNILPLFDSGVIDSRLTTHDSLSTVDCRLPY